MDEPLEFPENDLVELPEGKTFVVFLPDLDGFVGRTDNPTVVDKIEDARVFANEYAANMFFRRMGMEVAAEIM